MTQPAPELGPLDAAIAKALAPLSKKLDAIAKTLTERIEEVEAKADQNTDELHAQLLAPIRQKAITLPEIVGDDAAPPRAPPTASQAVTAAIPARLTDSMRVMAAASATQAKSLRAIEVATAKQAPIAEATAASAKTSAIEIEKQTPLLHAVVANGTATLVATAKGATAQQISAWVQAIASGLVVVIVGVLGYLGLGQPRQPAYAPPPGYVLVPAGALPAAPAPAPPRATAPAPSR